jgi:DNA invertase Pin-like site-specific DNA recombinase
MMTLVRTGQADYVVVYSTDHSFRNGTSLLKFVSDLHKLGIEFVSATEPALDCRTLSGRLMLACMAMITELPVWNASERTRESLRVRLEAGLPNGAASYGYCNGLCKTGTDPNGKGCCPLYRNPGRPQSEQGGLQVPHPIEQHAVRLIGHL